MGDIDPGDWPGAIRSWLQNPPFNCAANASIAVQDVAGVPLECKAELAASSEGTGGGHISCSGVVLVPGGPF